jgi:hypothetical protein
VTSAGAGVTFVEAAEATAPTADAPRRGSQVGSFTITALISDSRHVSVLQARDEDRSFVALKVARTHTGEGLVGREACLLQARGRSEGATPRFRANGIVEGRRYSVVTFRPGTEVRAAAATMRELGGPQDVLGLCCRVARAYALLHESGVVHGAVHPRHVLVDHDGSIWLLDFATAASATDVPPSAWLAARFNTLSAPEHAEAVLRGEDQVLTPAAEQYSVAALLHLVATGRMYAPLRLRRRETAEDIIAARPLPERELTGCPELGQVLSRALRMARAERFASMGAMAGALEDLHTDAAARTRPSARRRPVTTSLTEMLDRFLRDADRETPIESLKPPTCSVNFGAAGVAFALTRLGKVTSSTAVLELADRWLAAAERHRKDADAFDDGGELTPETVGPVSPYHTTSGLPAVRAFLSAALGDTASEQAAIDDFRILTSAPCPNLDLTLGRASVLLFAALLYARADPDGGATATLGDHGDHLCAEIWRNLPERLPYYGIAHGWAGIAFATLMWTQARSSQPPGRLSRVLELLAAAAEPWGRGLRWPVSPMDGPVPDQFWPGWCHGNAGHVFLWNLARAAYGEDQFATLAERAALLIDRSPGFTSLCCGSAGQAYALLNHHRSTGEERWRRAAVRLAISATTHDALAGDATTGLSLYKGHVGFALLAAELESPEEAAMPLFEFEPFRRADARTERFTPKVRVGMTDASN